MSVGLIGALVVLALIDSTSFGTLLIPIWMMITPGRLRWSRLVIFLATVAVFYFALGVALLVGVAALWDDLQPVFASRAFMWIQLAVGVGLLILSFRKRRRRESGRLTRWRERAMDGEGPIWPLIGLALGAVALEAASMLPYLGAIGLLSSSSLSLPQTVAVLAGYCAVMILPALVLLTLRVAAARRVQPVLERVNGWMSRNATENTQWILGILGFLIARDALAKAYALGMLDGFLKWADSLN